MAAVIELEIGTGDYSGARTVRVLRASGSEGGRIGFELDVDGLAARRGAVEATVLASSVPTRRVLTPGESEVQQIGAELFDRLFDGDVGTAYRTSRAVAQAHGESLQLRLRLMDPALAALPWEALYDRSHGTYLCRKESLIRQIAAPESLVPLRVEPPMRILGLIASPRNLPALDVEGERHRLEQALAPHVAAGLAELDWIEDVTWDRLHGRLLSEPCHVLHFVGHSRYEDETDEGVLAFCGPDGRADYVGAAALADLLDEAEPEPRLVVLNSCMSGAGGLNELYSGTAAALVRGGISAVVAMQFTVSDSAALAFARGFYAALAHGRSIDDATRSGRIAILGLGRDTLEWVTPVLYLRGEDTRLFTVDAAKIAQLRAPAPARDAASVTPAPPLDAPVPREAEPRAEELPAAPEPSEQPAAAAVASAPLRASTAETHAAGPPAPPPRDEPASAGAAETDGDETARRPRGRRALVVTLSVLALIALLAGGYLLVSAFPRQPVTAAGSTESATPTAPAPSATTRALVIPSSQLWTSTGIPCVSGDPLKISAEGIVQHGSAADRVSGPDGMAGEVLPTNVVDDANHAALIGRIGDAGMPFFVGSSYDEPCNADGVLFLGINDEGYEGNIGDFDVTVTYLQ
ncbi:CHAT domain-containing protein [Microbacterium sp. E-13]|uniref:CHAT domain-containing protein n=1 Tax=Microbacterium sp. E-13 TaxID=3404048 RepID=UPI003CF2226B